MSRKTHEKELARARAKRAAERAAQQRTRRYASVVVVAIVAVVAVVVGLALRGGDTDDPGTDPVADPTDPSTDPTDPVDPDPTHQTWDAPPAMQIDPDASYVATVETTLGTVELELFAADAPITVNNFVFLAREGFYDGVIFHRVIEGFMIQGGDPTGTGSGGPGYQFEDELDTVAQYGFGRGMLAMANGGPNTNGSQFFIVHGDASHLQTHTVFGQVIEGFDTLDAIATTPVGPGDRPLEDVVIVSVEIIETPA